MITKLSSRFPFSCPRHFSTPTGQIGGAGVPCTGGAGDREIGVLQQRGSDVKYKFFDGMSTWNWTPTCQGS